MFRNISLPDNINLLALMSQAFMSQKSFYDKKSRVPLLTKTVVYIHTLDATFPDSGSMAYTLKEIIDKTLFSTLIIKCKSSYQNLWQ